ncbi:MAG: universal stress protein [Candidatus Xiphinematobacter sp.]|nr:MAG: universal stress protein [Candidatus Xiphinematobacter sp.]
MENSVADSTILGHVCRLAHSTGGHLHLLHVASGWVARNYDQLNLTESEEMKNDLRYLQSVAQALQNGGLDCNYELAMGEPSNEIVRVAREREVDLIAMSTHGHRFLGDLIYGNTVDRVRHRVGVPVLLLKASGKEER